MSDNPTTRRPAKRPPPLPLRAQVYIRQRDALLRRPVAKGCPMSRRELQAMLWEHRAMDVLYRGGQGEDDWGMAECSDNALVDADELIPF